MSCHQSSPSLKWTRSWLGGLQEGAGFYHSLDEVEKIIRTSAEPFAEPSAASSLMSSWRLTGAHDRRQAIACPNNTFASVKRLIGRKFDSAKKQAKLVFSSMAGVCIYPSLQFWSVQCFRDPKQVLEYTFQLR